MFQSPKVSSESDKISIKERLFEQVAERIKTKLFSAWEDSMYRSLLWPNQDNTKSVGYEKEGTVTVTHPDLNSQEENPLSVSNNTTNQVFVF